MAAAPLNVSAKRLPKALGPLQPIEHEGKPIDFEDPPDEAETGEPTAEQGQSETPYSEEAR